jgi:hypothetical protein
MATPAQLSANRANATHSTGPVSVRGKQASSCNATTHGLTSSQIVVPGEDPAAFEALRSDTLTRLAPEGDLETSLAESVAVARWRHVRMMRYESAFWKLRVSNHVADMADRGFPDADPDISAASFFLDPDARRELSLIHRYLTSAERAYSRAFREFENAVAKRPEDAANPSADASEEPCAQQHTVTSAPPVETSAAAPKIAAQTEPLLASELGAEAAVAARHDETSTADAVPSPIGFVSQNTPAARRDAARARRKAEKKARRTGAAGVACYPER